MDELTQTTFGRRRFHRLALALPVSLAVASLGRGARRRALADEATAPATPALAGTPIAAPTPDCAHLTVTPGQTEGPYFKAGSPARTSLIEPGMTGTKLTVTGYVYTADCKPVAGALLDFWQADDSGRYDNAGYRLRGHLLTDQAGRYQLETIVPGLYPGRTRHIHVKVQAPNRPALTTQLYFPNEPHNDADGIFSPALVMDVKETAGGKVGLFTFILAV